MVSTMHCVNSGTVHRPCLWMRFFDHNAYGWGVLLRVPVAQWEWSKLRTPRAKSLTHRTNYHLQRFSSGDTQYLRRVCHNMQWSFTFACMRWWRTFLCVHVAPWDPVSLKIPQAKHLIRMMMMWAAGARLWDRRCGAVCHRKQTRQRRMPISIHPTNQGRCNNRGTRTVDDGVFRWFRHVFRGIEGNGRGSTKTTRSRQTTAGLIWSLCVRYQGDAGHSRLWWWRQWRRRYVMTRPSIMPQLTLLQRERSCRTDADTWVMSNAARDIVHWESVSKSYFNQNSMYFWPIVFSTWCIVGYCYVWTVLNFVCPFVCERSHVLLKFVVSSCTCVLSASSSVLCLFSLCSHSLCVYMCVYMCMAPIRIVQCWKNPHPVVTGHLHPTLYTQSPRSIGIKHPGSSPLCLNPTVVRRFPTAPWQRWHPWWSRRRTPDRRVHRTVRRWCRCVNGDVLVADYAKRDAVHWESSTRCPLCHSVSLVMIAQQQLSGKLMSFISIFGVWLTCEKFCFSFLWDVGFPSVHEMLRCLDHSELCTPPIQQGFQTLFWTGVAHYCRVCLTRSPLTWCRGATS